MVRLMQERSGCRLSQTELAKKIGVSRATIQNWESGKSEITSSKVIALCAIFGCSADWLLDLSNERTKISTNQNSA